MLTDRMSRLITVYTCVSHPQMFSFQRLNITWENKAGFPQSRKTWNCQGIL